MSRASRATPSGFVRQALIDYSKEHKRSRSKSPCKPRKGTVLKEPTTGVEQEVGQQGEQLEQQLANDDNRQEEQHDEESGIPPVPIGSTTSTIESIADVNAERDEARVKVVNLDYNEGERKAKKKKKKKSRGIFGYIRGWIFMDSRPKIDTSEFENLPAGSSMRLDPYTKPEEDQKIIIKDEDESPLEPFDEQNGEIGANKGKSVIDLDDKTNKNVEVLGSENAADAHAPSSLEIGHIEVTFASNDDLHTVSEPSSKSYRDSNNCCCITLPPPQYLVPPNLSDGNDSVQSRFIQKIFSLLFLKVLAVFAWLKVTDSTPFIKAWHQKASPFCLLSLLLYIFFKCALRYIPFFPKRNIFLHIFIYVTDILIVGFALTYAMTQWLENYFVVLQNVMYGLMGTFSFFTFVGFFVNYDMRDGIMIGSALTVTAVMSFHDILHDKNEVDRHRMTYTEEIVGTTIVLIVSELLITLIMFDLKSILTGYCFPPTHSDWFLTANYII